MPPENASGKAITVLGPVDPAELGVTITHEHLLVDLGVVFVEPDDAEGRRLAEEKVSLENLGWIRINWSSNRDNLVQADVELAVREAARYRRAGGGTIVDATSIGFGRNPAALAAISRATGLHIVMGAGYYVEPAHPEDFKTMSVDDVTAQIVRDIEEGVGDTGVRSGIIGEIGCSWPWTPDERKSVTAAVAAQRETGAPLLIHPGRNQRAPLEIVDFIEREGGDVGRTIMAHVEVRIFDEGILRELGATGVYLEYDTFGLDVPFPAHAPDTFMPSDFQRIEQILGLIADGYGDRILLAHDNCTKHRLRKYGGHGFDHILGTVVPWMRRQGIGEDQLTALLTDNPRRILTFA